MKNSHALRFLFVAAIVLLFGFAPEMARAQIRRALVVGINNYAPGYIDTPLSCCVNDAIFTKDTMLLGDPMLRWSAGNIAYLTNADATKAAIRAALQSLATRSKPGDLVVYYQSGHGGGSGLNSFICSYNAHYTDAELGADLALFKSSVKVVVIIDACHSGGMFKDPAAGWNFAQNAMAACEAVRSQMQGEGGELQAKALGSNIAFMTACDYDELSYEGAHHGVYTGNLLDGCWNPLVDTNHDGAYQFAELHTYAAGNCSGLQTAQSLNATLLNELVVRNVDGYPGDQTPHDVHRFWSNRYRGHFFTISEPEKDHIVANLSADWSYEGTAYPAFVQPRLDAVPLYRFWSNRYRGHFFTISEPETDHVYANLSRDWSYEGVAYYVYPDASAGGAPVYRFWSNRYKHHFFTVSEAEKDNIVANLSSDWSYEGIAFYVPVDRSARSVASPTTAIPMALADDASKDAGLASALAHADIVFPLAVSGGQVSAKVSDMESDEDAEVLAAVDVPVAVSGVETGRRYRLEVSVEDPDGDTQVVHASAFERRDNAPDGPGDVGATRADAGTGVGNPIERIVAPSSDGPLTLRLWSAARGVVETRSGVVGGETVEFASPDWNCWHWVGGWRESDGELVLSLWLRHEIE